MTTNDSKRQVPKPDESVIQWLLDSDHSIRWQAMQALTDASAEEVAAERAKIATKGWDAQMLALQGTDGSWAGAAWNGQVAASGAYFGQDIQRIIDEQLDALIVQHYDLRAGGVA